MNKRRLRLMAHNVRSLWNVGSLFRTSDAFDVEKIYLTGYTGTPPRKEITKTAIGAEEFVDWESNRDPMIFIDQMKQEGWQVVSLELTDNAADLVSFKPSNQVCLILGHELDGVDPELLPCSDAVVQIPMLGQKESLNVATAAGIALHQFRFVT